MLAAQDAQAKLLKAHQGVLVRTVSAPRTQTLFWPVSSVACPHSCQLGVNCVCSVQCCAPMNSLYMYHAAG